jgi:hypothetical protein
MNLTRILLSGLFAAALCAPAQAAGRSASLMSGAFPVKFEANVIEQKGSSLTAQGNVLMLSCDRRLTASEVHYDWSTGRAELKNATLTTCANPRPDYHIEAESLVLMAPNRIKARKAAFFLGRTRIIMLPSLRMRIGGRRQATDLFPRPSYDKDAGLGVSQRLLLMDSDRAFATAVLRFSAKNGFEGDFESAFGFDGYLTPTPLQPLTFPAYRADGLAIPVPISRISCYEERPSEATRLRGFARVSSHFRTYNAHDPNLLIYRQPELGLSYSAPAITMGKYTLDSRLPVEPVAELSWGRYTEVLGAGPLNRRDFGFSIPVNLATVGPRTVIQPIVQFSQSNYETGQSYTWGAASVGLNHLRPDGTFHGIRYIKRGQRGSTPFQFDQLYVLDEVQAAVQFHKNGNTLGLVAGYDIGNKALYDWSALLAHSTDCVGVSLSWSNLERKIVFGVQLLSN